MDVHPQHALAVYAESFAAGARVAVFGDSSIGLGERLRACGAEAVYVWDPDGPRAQGRGPAAGGVLAQAYASYEPPAQSLDLAIVFDLGLFDDPALLLARIRGLLERQGVALIAAANRETSAPAGTRAFDYYELFDRVADKFSRVTMVAEIAFHGAAFVTLGDQDSDSGVSVDPQLADEHRIPAAFIAIASQDDPAVDPYAIVELPAPCAPPSTPEAEDRAHAIVATLQAEVALQTQRNAALESTLTMRTQQLSELSMEGERLRGAAETARRAAAEAEEGARRAVHAEARAAAFERELDEAVEAHAAELLRFEEALKERAQAVRLLEAEVGRRERMVRDLVGALEEADGGKPERCAPAENTPAPPDRVDVVEENARLRAQLDALALDLARREGDAQAAAWSIAELERRVADS